jgi:hypothetical protein
VFGDTVVVKNTFLNDIGLILIFLNVIAGAAKCY